jgi:AraC-like DNA-binding protein
LNKRDSRELGGAWTRFQVHSFPPPAPDLALYVDHYWVVTWDYAEPYEQKIVSYPRVNLTFRDGRGLLVGVTTKAQIRVLQGRSGVFGVQFRPGGFRPFLRGLVSTITDQMLDPRDVLEPELPELAGPLGLPDIEDVEAYLRACRPAPDPKAEEAADLVARIASKPDLTRVDAVAREAGTTVRSLQRLFADYVGVGPKWVIRRYRLHEVTERLSNGARIDWAELAAELGYADQAHFVRDFKSMFGESPTWYAERY